MRRTIRTIGWIGLACILMGLATSAAGIAQVQATHPRDEAGYLHDAHRYTRGEGGLRAYDAHVLMTDPTDRQLIQAGDRACVWLGKQPPGLFMTSYRFSPKRLADIYWKTTMNTQWAMPRQVYRDAWERLCPSTLFLVKPHFVFRSPPSD